MQTEEIRTTVWIDEIGDYRAAVEVVAVHTPDDPWNRCERPERIDVESVFLLYLEDEDGDQLRRQDLAPAVVVWATELVDSRLDDLLYEGVDLEEVAA